MFIATEPEKYAGRVVGNGHCVAFVQRVSKAGLTHNWRPGARVRGSSVPRGTVIATFAGGRYASRKGGSAHAAVLISQESGGIRVWDQWVGKPVGERLIRFLSGQGSAVNDGDSFYVVVV